VLHVPCGATAGISLAGTIQQGGNAVAVCSPGLAVPYEVAARYLG
jgi:hypothetical protein